MAKKTTAYKQRVREVEREIQTVAAELTRRIKEIHAGIPHQHHGTEFQKEMVRFMGVLRELRWEYETVGEDGKSIITRLGDRITELESSPE